MDNDLLEIFVREVKLQCVFAQAAFNGMVTELHLQDQRRNDLRQQAQKLSDQHRAEMDAFLYGQRTPASHEFGRRDQQQAYRELFDRHTQEMMELYEEGTTWTVFFTYSFLVHAAIVSKILWSGTKVHGREKRAVGLDNADELSRIRASRSEILRSELDITGTWLIESTDLRNDLEHYDERIETWYLTSPRRNRVDLSLMPRSSVGGMDPQDFRRNLDPSTLSFFIEDNDYDLPAMMKELNELHRKAVIWLRTSSRFAKAKRAGTSDVHPDSSQGGPD